MKRLVWAFLISPIFVAAQVHGVSFLQNVSWQDVLQKAKAEDKYIFVDCYASWCGPCKWMDKHVYSSDTVARTIDDRFVAVKIQMDSTTHDGTAVMRWYATAHQFADQYQVKAYPSYLFFSPDGRIVHEAIGAMDVEDFLKLAATAMDPGHQYYILLARYQHGDMKYPEMPDLANLAMKLGQTALELQIVQDYTHHYLEGLPIKQLWTKDNLAFIGSYAKVISSEDRLFQLYYFDEKKIDSIMGKAGYADRLINTIIYREEIVPASDTAVKGKTEPDWDRLGQVIEKKYNKRYADWNTLKGKVDFYHTTKEWKKYITCLIQWHEVASIPSIQRGAIDSTSASFFLNNLAWEIFNYSQNKEQLEKALAWTDWALSLSAKADPQAMDTKANILYKLGKKNEAVNLEEQSYSLATKDNDIRQNLEKMKSDLPTWFSK